MAVDLLFHGVLLRRKRNFNLNENLLDGLSEAEVKSRYRFSRNSIQFITDTLAADLERPTGRNRALKPQEQVLVALRFFASGSFLEVVGDTVGGIPKCTVSRIVSRVSTALVRKQHEFIRWPSTAAERQERKQGEAICDHKDEYRIVLYLTVGLFTNVVAKWPGSTHDSFVFTNSLIHERLESNHAFEDGYLLGDSGYPCKPFLMTPYPNTANAKEEAFNKAHCKTRVAIEQTFGRWKRRFHLLHSECRMKPEKVCTLIGACAVLHNISIRLNDDIDDDPFDDDQPELVPYHGPDQGRLLRDHICNTFF
ncbi:PREDICTED: putative nuclease HARBI1 [Acropora digitifera]|uniref:putative nuclease HARBI1 n=1 Tax=Acropora digitifera TaxID=70779 RepID=UPI00077A04E1|nr:PREDICTED: putative nuclease HARBI1 [Acropora digitifera]